MQRYIEIPINIISIEGDGFHLIAEGRINDKVARFVVDTVEEAVAIIEEFYHKYALKPNF